jgi:ribonuclease VapC
MVIDTSALLAILCDEPEMGSFCDAMEADPVRLVSAANVLETAIVVETRFGVPGAHELDLLLRVAACEVVAVDVRQCDAARDAYRRFGKGRHPASLNFGDCFAYALASTSGEPLLFKGDDFAKTDLRRA